MKVIFLDVDGVLNTSDTFKRRKEIYNERGILIPRIDFFRVSYLKEIVNKTKAKIVLSSTWRKNEKNIEELFNVFKLFDLEIYDLTDIDIDGIRENEIISWLNNNEVETFIIIDDESSDLHSLENYLIKTRVNGVQTGLLEEHIDKAINILNNSKKLVLNNNINNE